jgi:Putative methyltransferase
MEMKWRAGLRRFGWGVWSSWPEEAYRNDRYQQRLAAVQTHLTECLDLAPPGSIRITSLCAGDGRDVIGVVGSHQRRSHVAASLVELNRQSVANGIRQAATAGLEKTAHFINADATLFATYRNVLPADIVMVCGVWGHVPAAERVQFVHALGSLCKPGAAVIWTRGVSQGATRLLEIQSLFAASSWKLVRESVTPDGKWAVVTNRYGGPQQTLPEDGQMFHFRRSAGQRELAHSRPRFIPSFRGRVIAATPGA